MFGGHDCVFSLYALPKVNARSTYLTFAPIHWTLQNNETESLQTQVCADGRRKLFEREKTVCGLGESK